MPVSPILQLSHIDFEYSEHAKLLRNGPYNASSRDNGILFKMEKVCIQSSQKGYGFVLDQHVTQKPKQRLQQPTSCGTMAFNAFFILCVRITTSILHSWSHFLFDLDKNHREFEANRWRGIRRQLNPACRLIKSSHQRQNDEKPTNPRTWLK